jgi:hypothetical protein
MGLDAISVPASPGARSARQLSGAEILQRYF